MSYNRSPSASAGSGTVTSVSVTTANGVSGSVATATTTPAISLTLGAITPTTVVASGAISGSNLSGTNTGNQTIALTGDVTGSGTGTFAATVALVGGSSAANVNTATGLANAATSANTASTIVKRDGSGNFTAGTVTTSNLVIADDGFLSIGSQSSVFSSKLGSPGTLAADVTLTLPAATGGAGQVMQDTDGNGALGWRDAGVSQTAVNNSITVLNGKQVSDLIGLSNVTLSGVQTLDGASTSGASIVLLAGQTDPTENGMWTVDDFLPWTRPAGWANGISAVPGSLVSISSNSGGVSYSNTLWFGIGDGSSTASYQRIPVSLTSNTGWGSITNVSTDKAYNANATTIDELADVLGTLIAQLVSQGILRT